MKSFNLALLLVSLFTFSFIEASEFPKTSYLHVSQQIQKTVKAEDAKIVFKSADGGKTWQNISHGLPKSLQDEYAVSRDAFFVNDNGIYINTQDGIYYSKANAAAPFWNKDTGGKNWKQIHTGGRRNVAELNGILLATSNKGIIRSTDKGKNWELVISEGGVGIAVERIEGGFAAITYNSMFNIRRVRTSYDGGKTWQIIDDGLPASLTITSIIQVGENFFCGHPTGIYKSSDKGKTWELILPSIEKKVFNLSVSGNVIYAIPGNEGC